MANAVFGEYGAAFVRRIGSGRDLRWLIIAPLEDEGLLSCVLRAAEPRDLEAEGAFVVPATGIPEEPTAFSPTMRLCVSARMSAPDEFAAIATGEVAREDDDGREENQVAQVSL